MSIKLLLAFLGNTFCISENTEIHSVFLKSLYVKEAGRGSGAASSPRQLPLLGMAAMEKGSSMLERPHGPVIIIPEQETLVFEEVPGRGPGGGGWQLLCRAAPARLARVPRSPLCLWIPSGTGNAAFSLLLIQFLAVFLILPRRRHLSNSC